jgi:threonine/homoserine/homoserine lactone efflux protein
VVGAGYLVAFAALKVGPEHEVLFGGAIAAFMTTDVGVSFAALYHLAMRQRQRWLRGERLLAEWMLADEVSAYNRTRARTERRT